MGDFSSNDKEKENEPKDKLPQSLDHKSSRQVFQIEESHHPGNEGGDTQENRQNRRLMKKSVCRDEHVVL